MGVILGLRLTVLVHGPGTTNAERDILFWQYRCPMVDSRARQRLPTLFSKPNWWNKDVYRVVTVAACLYRWTSGWSVDERCNPFRFSWVFVVVEWPDWLTKDSSEWSKMLVSNRHSEMPEVKPQGGKRTQMPLQPLCRIAFKKELHQNITTFVTCGD